MSREKIISPNKDFKIFGSYTEVNPLEKCVCGEFIPKIEDELGCNYSAQEILHMPNECQMCQNMCVKRDKESVLTAYCKDMKI